MDGECINCGQVGNWCKCDERTLFNKPIRQLTTAIFHEDKISLDEFIEDFQDGLPVFKQNMEHLNIIEHKFIEEWAETFLAWMEIEQE
jgi:hypothetical protein